MSDGAEMIGRMDLGIVRDVERDTLAQQQPKVTPPRGLVDVSADEHGRHVIPEAGWYSIGYAGSQTVGLGVSDLVTSRVHETAMTVARHVEQQREELLVHELRSRGWTPPPQEPATRSLHAALGAVAAAERLGTSTA